MTRKTFLILAIMACILFPLSAFDYRLDLISLTPLYEEYDADNHRASLDFQYGQSTRATRRASIRTTTISPSWIPMC